MQLGITDGLWVLYHDLYNCMSCVVKWEGEYCTEFNETQGVGQGGIPSTELFKVRGDSLLHRIEKMPPWILSWDGRSKRANLCR